MESSACHIDIGGMVQGIGFRPFIYHHALQHQLKGWVRNHSGGIEIHIEGTKSQCEHFSETLTQAAPPASQIHSIEVHPAKSLGLTTFSIDPSLDKSFFHTHISPDIGLCNDCIDDMRQQQKRIRFPFTNCTHCGPRFSILQRLPYDRQHTSMTVFSMCPDCRNEYEDISNRRFHAQPVSCWNCGPEYEWIDSDALQEKQRISKNEFNSYPREFIFQKGLEKLVQAIYDGKIIALKGLGGFQLICDATNPVPIRRLREIKQRWSKPFAVMMKDMETILRYADVNETETEILQSWRRSIVILKQHYSICEELNRGFNTIGVLLPYNPLQYLLLENLDKTTIVFTSANLTGEPIIQCNKDILEFQSKGYCDAIFLHNREIIHRLDDSIVRNISGKPSILRRARGYAPEAIETTTGVGGILAMGADLKNTFCIGTDNRAIMSQYIGDLGEYGVLNHYRDEMQKILDLYRISPRILACDKHPDYHSSKYAENLRKTEISSQEAPELIRIQHHHAHIASVMAEHGLDEKIIGISLDGTGYGDDGKSWGSEFMIADLTDYTRQFHLAYMPLPGMESAIREPWRIAVAILYDLYGPPFSQMPLNFLKEIHSEKLTQVLKAYKKRINIGESCGAGRLFDVVAVLLNLVLDIQFESEGPVKLENIIGNSSEVYPVTLEGDAFVFKPIILEIISDLMTNIAPPVISAKFHNTIVEMILTGAGQIRSETGLQKVALSGGVFQNKFLTEKAIQLLLSRGFTPYVNERVPANDGGISLGQLVIASKKRNLCV